MEVFIGFGKMYLVVNQPGQQLPMGIYTLEKSESCPCGLQQGTEAEGYHHPECPEWDGRN